MGQTTSELAIAELAKLLLSNSPIDVEVSIEKPNSSRDSEFIIWFSKKMLEAHDSVPSLIVNIQSAKCSDSCITYYLNGDIIAKVGRIEPSSLDAIWVPVDLREFTDSLVNFLVQFSDAGYPGCVGCLDPVYENNWNERMHRESLRI